MKSAISYVKRLNLKTKQSTVVLYSNVPMSYNRITSIPHLHCHQTWYAHTITYWGEGVLHTDKSL